MTLVTLQTQEGKTRHCDARCYNAKKDSCFCICGGRNHAKGEKQAAINTVKLDMSQLREENRDSLTTLPWKLYREPVQLELI